jgi:hypothetical protein
MFDCKLTTWRPVKIGLPGKGKIQINGTVEATRLIKLPFVPAPEMRLELAADDEDSELDFFIIEKVFWVARHQRFDLEDEEERNITLGFVDEDEMHAAFQEAGWTVSVQQEQ